MMGSARSQVIVAVGDPSGVGEARRAAAALAASLGFGETETGRVAIVASEAATNLARYAQGGELLLRAVERGGAPGVEILAIDRGPGIADLARALRDGYSTRPESAGTGMGAMTRLATDFDVTSTVGQGTALLARLFAHPPGRASSSIRYGVVQVPRRGESVCGDAWTVVERGTRALVMVADGLGHGPLAAQASVAAVRVVEAAQDEPIEVLLERAHAALRGTRGAAVAIAEIVPSERRVDYCGMGNIAGTVFTAAGAPSSGMVSQNGTVGTAGHEPRRARRFRYALPADGLVVLYSDGLRSRVGLDGTPGLASRDPALVAAVLYRDFARGHDDATVVVVRVAAPVPESSFAPEGDASGGPGPGAAKEGSA